MGSTEQFKAQVSKEKRLKARLSLARTRLEEAEQEHIWAIAAAHSGLAGAFGPKPTVLNPVTTFGLYHLLVIF